MKEKRFIILQKVLWSGLLLLVIFFPNLIMLFEPEIKVVNEDVFVDYSYSYATVDIELEFSHSISEVDIKIAFYDENNIFISEESPISSWSESKFHEFTCYSVYVGSKEIGYYEITSIEYVYFDLTVYYSLMSLLIGITLTFLVLSFFLNYKEYSFNNKKISIYAGYFHHYLKIDDIIVDKYNGSSLVPIVLTTNIEKDIKIDVVISRANRFTVKINGTLID